MRPSKSTTCRSSGSNSKHLKTHVSMEDFNVTSMGLNQTKKHVGRMLEQHCEGFWMNTTTTTTTTNKKKHKERGEVCLLYKLLSSAPTYDSCHYGKSREENGIPSMEGENISHLSRESRWENHRFKSAKWNGRGYVIVPRRVSIYYMLGCPPSQ